MIATRLPILAALISLVLTTLATAAPTTVDKATREKILLLGNSDDPRGLDPHKVSGVIEHNITRALFEGLVIKHPERDGQVLPGVAERWQADGDSKRWVFHIRKDATWSDGHPLTAEDFVFSFTRALSPEMACDYAFMLFDISGARDFNEGKTKDTSKFGLRAPDLHTLIIELELFPWRR